jgi:hypothetical protein
LRSKKSPTTRSLSRDRRNPVPSVAKISQRVIGLHALLFHEDHFWIAQIVEYSLATCAKDRDALLAELERFLTVQVVGTIEAGYEPFVTLPPPSEFFSRLFDQISERSVLQFQTPVSISLTVELAWVDDPALVAELETQRDRQWLAPEKLIRECPLGENTDDAQDDRKT